MDSIVTGDEKKKGNLIFKDQQNPSKCLILRGAIPQSQVILDSSGMTYYMKGFWFLIGFVVIWILLQAVILPKFGVQT